MKHQLRVPIILRVSRESHYFDLGLEIGNIDLYCKTLIDFVIAAIATDMRAGVFGTRGDSWSFLTDYEQIIAHFAFVVGRNMDIEKITEDLVFIYSHLRPVIDNHYPNWSFDCPGSFHVRITPGNYDFMVDL